MDHNNPFEQQQNPQYGHNPFAQQGFGMQIPLPNATVIMVLGICSIVLCGLGPILGTIALILGKGARTEYESKPGVYDPASYSSVKTGRVCGIIGICVGVFFWLIIGAYMLWVWYMTQMVYEAMEQIQIQQQ
jgi:hypothetical protein